MSLAPLLGEVRCLKVQKRPPRNSGKADECSLKWTTLNFSLQPCFPSCISYFSWQRCHSPHHLVLAALDFRPSSSTSEKSVPLATSHILLGNSSSQISLFLLSDCSINHLPPVLPQELLTVPQTCLPASHQQSPEIPVWPHCLGRKLLSGSSALGGWSLDFPVIYSRSPPQPSLAWIPCTLFSTHSPPQSSTSCPRAFPYALSSPLKSFPSSPFPSADGLLASFKNSGQWSAPGGRPCPLSFLATSPVLLLYTCSALLGMSLCTYLLMFCLSS